MDAAEGVGGRIEMENRDREEEEGAGGGGVVDDVCCKLGCP
jgi:hypothetical protein